MCDYKLRPEMENFSEEKAPVAVTNCLLKKTTDGKFELIVSPPKNGIHEICKSFQFTRISRFN